MISKEEGSIMSQEISGFEYAKQHEVKKPLVMLVNGEAMDLSRKVDSSSEIKILTKDDPEALEIMRHTSAHILAQALRELFPNIKLAIGPVIENGFYYDILSDCKITPDDFEKIEKKVREIIKANIKVSRTVLSKDEAKKIFEAAGEKFKVELIDAITDDTVTLYSHDDKFMDLCRGPHLPSTGSVPNNFKIMRVSGSYWRGDAKRDVLMRVYATNWFTKEELETYIKNLEEAEKRDHRKIGRDMDLFHIQEEAAGSIFWHPKGWILYRLLRNFVRECIEEDGYVEVNTPQMIDRSLWEASGHWEKFKDKMFIAESEDRMLAIKPMNCPGHIQIYKQGIKSYKDLPLRMAEFGSCHRCEPSGSLYGTMRVRGFVQDDAHIFCTPEQINSETKRFCNLLKKVYKSLGFENFSVKFSDRPEVRAGTDEIWDLAEDLLKKATLEAGLAFTTNKGEGAFYGPKLEFVLKDKLGRDWQCGTLQVDFILPVRLNAFYTNKNGDKEHPIMLHRAILGSLERFIGILLENYAGHLPIWLAPVQIVLATVTNDSDSYARSVFEKLKALGLRPELDVRAEKISYKIREHTLKKVPYIAVIGAQEAQKNTLNVRKHDGTQQEITFDSLVSLLKAQA